MTMERSQDSRMNGRQYGPKIGLIMGTALASIALTGCTTTTAPQAGNSFSKAQVALEKGQVTKAIGHAEAAVLAEPRNSGYRAMLGAAYLEAGRFDAAATSFDDALELGNQDARTVLSYALAKIAAGESATALAKLGEWEGAINPADYGLALALAGNPERGTHILINTLRGGQNTAKVRQNLAYTYALAGNWRAARVMAAEDVPAGQLDQRLSDWAATSRPEAFKDRVANLLQVTPVTDPGQPRHLALANFPSQEQMVAEAAAQAPSELAAEGEPSAAEALAFAAPSDPVETVDPTPASKPAKVVKAVATTPAPKTKAPVSSGPRFVSNPVVQKLPSAKAPKAKPALARADKPAKAKPSSQRRMAATTSTAKADTHMVQLGSYSSRVEAERGWNAIKAKFPQLSTHDVVITKAEVKGKTYFRVAAAGFGQASAKQMCRTVKASGRGCFAYAASNPPKGAVDRGVRIAARTR